ncbi:MAG: hypothetical protein ACJAWV_001637 [Flammeovirgaceae bacterium]|jgi:hypothetical protein
MMIALFAITDIFLQGSAYGFVPIRSCLIFYEAV